jgi:hypothetical protein
MVSMRNKHQTQYIYALYYPNTQLYFYVGRTSSPRERLNNHRSRRHGFKVGLTILEYITLDNSNVEEAERYWMAELTRRGHRLQNAKHTY